MDSVFPILKSKVGVYLIVSPSGGRYIGSSKRLDKRFNRYKNLSCSKQSAIYSSLKKYGYQKHAFSILMYCEEVDLLFWERCFGDIYLASANFSQGLNIVLPGYDDVPQHRTQEFRDRISATQKERFKNPEERKKVGEKSRLAYSNPELRKRVSKIHKERCSTKDFSEKMSKSQSEYFKSKEARDRVSKSLIQYYIDNPEKVNLSGIQKYYEDNPNVRRDRMKQRFIENPYAGKEHSKKLKQFYIDNPAHRKNASERTKIQFSNPENHPASKKVLDTETGEIFASLTQVARRLNKPTQTVRNWVKGKVNNPTSYKYI